MVPGVLIKPLSIDGGKRPNGRNAHNVQLYNCTMYMTTLMCGFTHTKNASFVRLLLFFSQFVHTPSPHTTFPLFLLFSDLLSFFTLIILLSLGGGGGIAAQLSHALAHAAFQTGHPLCFINVTGGTIYPETYKFSTYVNPWIL